MFDKTRAVLGLCFLTCFVVSAYLSLGNEIGLIHMKGVIWCVCVCVWVWVWVGGDVGRSGWDVSKFVGTCLKNIESKYSY